MAKRCTKCGIFLTDEDRFCPNCGENAPQTVASDPGFTQANYTTAAPPPYPPRTAAQSGAGLPPPPVYPSAAYRPAQFEEEMTVGKWVITLIVTNFLGLISWIFLFIWAFGAGPTTRSRYCKAMLIVKAIATVLTIIFVFVYIIGIFPTLSYYADYGEFPYTEAAALLKIFA